MKRVESALYSYRLCDLPLEQVEERLDYFQQHLNRELQARGIRFQFHLYVSDDWFCPDGVPGIAMPFYLFSKKLCQIERYEVGYLEGSSEKQIMKLLRHELGHCIDNAYRLRKNRQRQRVFGSSKQEYPESYTPKKYSKNFVHYLGDNYAQSHPDEDFAETFAVWLDPESQWQQRYLGSGALRKLEFIDQLMHSLRNKRPFLKNNFRVDPIERLKLTLSEYYTEKSNRLNLGYRKRLDQQIQSIFSNEGGRKKQWTLGRYLRSQKSEICKKVAKRTGAYRYQVEFALNQTIERADVIQIHGTKAEFNRKSPLLVERNFRYLKENQQLKFYL